MFRIIALHSSKKKMAWAIIPLCLLLISTGITVSSLTGGHAAKPHPRAVMENSVKSAKDPAEARAALIELAQQPPALQTPPAGKSRFDTGPCRFSSITLTRSEARAPPRQPC